MRSAGALVADARTIAPRIDPPIDPLIDPLIDPTIGHGPMTAAKAAATAPPTSRATTNTTAAIARGPMTVAAAIALHRGVHRRGPQSRVRTDRVRNNRVKIDRPRTDRITGVGSRRVPVVSLIATTVTTVVGRRLRLPRNRARATRGRARIRPDRAPQRPPESRARATRGPARIRPGQARSRVGIRSIRGAKVPSSSACAPIDRPARSNSGGSSDPPPHGRSPMRGPHLPLLPPVATHLPIHVGQFWCWARTRGSVSERQDS